MNQENSELRAIINTEINSETFFSGEKYIPLDGIFNIIIFYLSEENEESSRRTLTELYGPIFPCSIDHVQLANLLSEPQLQEVHSRLKGASLVHMTASIKDGQKKNQWIYFPAASVATAEFSY